MRGILVVLAAAILLAGCLGEYTGATGLYPYNYKQITSAYIQKTYPYPAALRSVAISDPVQGHIGNHLGWLVCLQANAKNRAGDYDGLKRTALLINDGVVTQSTTNAPVCKDTSLEAWPEMEGK